MIVFLAIAILAALSFGAGWYLRKAEAGMIEARAVWPRLSANLNRLALDETVPDQVVWNMTAFASIAGCGCFAGNMALFVARKSLGIEKRSDNASTHDFDGLSPAQIKLVGAILTDLIAIDAAAKPWIGYLLRVVLENRAALDREIVKEEHHKLKVKDVPRTMVLARSAAERRHAFEKIGCHGGTTLLAA